MARRSSSKKLNLAAEPAEETRPKTPPAGEVGVDGIANYAGEIYAENNTKLLYDQAYGTPGSREWGEWEKLIRTNPFVSMGMDFVSGHIRDARVGVKASEKVPDGQRHADFVQWAITEALEPGVSEVNQQMVSGLTAGFSIHELVWGNVKHETLPGGSGYAVTRMAERLPSTMAHNAWHVRDGELAFVRQQGPDESSRWRTSEIPAEKLALFTWNRRGNNFAGYSVWRPVWYIARIQEQLLKLTGVSLVREGAGIPTAVTNSDRAVKLTPGQRTKLQRLLENLVFHENAAVVMPLGWDIKWVYSPAANKGHVLDAWWQLGQVILLQVQAQQLVLGVNGTGSRAVGDTHQSESGAFKEGVTKKLEDVWNGVGRRPYTGIVKKLVDANWGPQVEYPKLTLTLQKPQLSPSARLDAIQKGVNAGAITITAADENVVREEVGLGPIDEAQRDDEKAKKAALAPKVAPQGTGQGEDEEPTRPAKLSMQGGLFVPRRPLRDCEQVLELAAINNFLDAAPLDFETAVRPIVTEMLVKAAPAITAAMADGTPDEVATLPFDDERLREAIRRYLAAVRAAGNKQVARELKPKVKLSASVARRLAIRLAEGDEPGPDDETATEAIEAADEVVYAQEKALNRRMQNRLRGELEREAIDTVRTGGTGSEVISRTVVRQLETGAFKADAGTVTTRIWNVGRDEAARIMGGVTTVERSAVLDSGTCDVCERMDGETAPFGSEEHDRLTPPERNCKGSDRCRCLLVYRQGEPE